MFCKGGTCTALIYVFKILIELRTHHKNTKHRGVATEVLEGSMTPLPSFVFYKEMESDRSQKYGKEKDTRRICCGSK